MLYVNAHKAWILNIDAYKVWILNIDAQICGFVKKRVVWICVDQLWTNVDPHSSTIDTHWSTFSLNVELCGPKTPLAPPFAPLPKEGGREGGPPRGYHAPLSQLPLPLPFTNA